jgi:yecA family protein
VGEWRPLVGSPFPVERAAEDDQLMGLASRLGGEIAATLAAGGPFEPIFSAESEEDDADIDIAGWCLGFVAGMNLRRDLWEQELGEGLAGVFLPIVASTGDEELLADLPAEELADIENRLPEEIAIAAVEVYGHFSEGGSR